MNPDQEINIPIVSAPAEPSKPEINNRYHLVICRSNLVSVKSFDTTDKVMEEVCRINDEPSLATALGTPPVILLFYGAHVDIHTNTMRNVSLHIGGKPVCEATVDSASPVNMSVVKPNLESR